MLQFLKRKKPNTLKLYRHVSETPLSVFIDCDTNSNYKRLIIEGEADEKTLQNAWITLWYEYCDKTNSHQYSTFSDLIKEVSYNKAKFHAIQMCVQVLRHMPDEQCVNILKKYGFRYNYSRANMQEFQSTLDRVMMLSKSLMINIQQDEIKLEKMFSEISEKEISKDDIWANNLSVVGKYMGFAIYPEKTTVLQFIQMKKMYEAEIEHLSNSKEKGENE